MKVTLNFGPSERTSEQRQMIADRALAITLEEEIEAREEILILYKKYVEGQVDLYAISVHVGEQNRKKFLALRESNNLV